MFRGKQSFGDDISNAYYFCVFSCDDSTAIGMAIDREWKGNWFPMKPGEIDPFLDVNIGNNNDIDSSSTYKTRMKTMGITDPKCDDAEVLDGN